MKRYYSFLILSLLPISLSVAQSSTTKPGTTSRSAVKPPATRPAATDVSSGDQAGSSTPATSPNRRQELYDQYHSQTKRPAAQTPASSPAVVETEAQKPTMAEASSRTQSSAAASPKDDGSSSGVRIGIRGGATYLVFTEENPFAKPAVGFVGGVTFNFGKGMLSFQPEVNYARYSTKFSALGPSISATADFIEVPLFLKISSGTYEGNRFFVNVGPYATYLISESIGGEKAPLEGGSDRFGFGAAAGVGAAIKAGPGHFTVEVRGHYPLGDLDNGFSTDANTIFSQASVGYIFPLGGR